MPLLTTNVPKSPYELIRPGNIATITQSGTIAEYAFDASGNVIGLVGPSGTIPLAGISAEGFGASPSASAAVNTAAIQAALNRTGLVTLTTPGTYILNALLTIYSDTTLYLGSGVVLKHDTNTNLNMIRNANWGSTTGSNWIPLTSITTADGLTCTVTSTSPHGLSTNNIVLINGAIPDDFNDVVQITVTSPTVFTYQRDKVTGGTFTSPATFSSATFTGTSSNASKVVTGISSMTGVACGMNVVGTNIPAGARVDTIDSATQFTMTLAATGTNTGLTASFPLQCTLADRNIQIIGPGTFDHNQTNQTTPDSYQIFSIALRNVGDSVFSNFKSKDSASALNIDGSYRNIVEKIRIDGATRVQSNGMHPCSHSGRDVTVRDISGTTKDDFVSIIQKEYVQYMDAGTPIGNITRLKIENIHPNGSLSCVKVLPVAGLTCDDIVLSDMRDRVSKSNYIAAPCYDPVNTGAFTTGAALSVGTIQNLTIDGGSMVANATSTFVNATAKSKCLTIKTFTCDGISTGKVLQVNANSVIDRLRVFDAYIGYTAQNLAIQINGGSCLDIMLDNITCKGASTFLKLDTGSPNNVVVKASNVVLDGCNSFMGFTGQTGVKIWCTNCQHVNYASNWLQNSSSSQWFARMINCDIPDANYYGGTTNNCSTFWSGEQAATLTSGASVAVDGLLRPRKKLTIGTNPTIANPTSILQFNLQEGYLLTFLLTEDGTGNHTITWGTNYVFPVAFVQSGVGSAGKSTIVQFVFDGVGKFMCINGGFTWT